MLCLQLVEGVVVVDLLVPHVFDERFQVRSRLAEDEVLASVDVVGAQLACLVDSDEPVEEGALWRRERRLGGELLE